MWQVWQACGWRASLTENVWRVWQASQEAMPKPRPWAFSSRTSPSLLRPSLWQPPQPFMPSIMATGWAWAVGMAFMAAQASACLPFLNCATCVSWQAAQVSGVGISALAASVALWCASPWQIVHSTPAPLCLLSCQSATMPGEVFLWQSMQVLACAPAARKVRAAATRT